MKNKDQIALLLSAKEPAPIFSSGTEASMPIFTFQPAQYISIACGKSWIEIDCQTGAVKLPKDVPLDEAAVKFWHAVAEVFPEVRLQIIEGKRKQ